MSFNGLLASIAAILAATLLPWSNFVGHSHWAQVQWIPFYGHRLDWLDIAANFALFVPFGYFAGGLLLIPWRKRKNLWVLVAATLLSTSVEFVQIYSHSRFPSATDICCNVLGAALGLMLAAGRVRYLVTKGLAIAMTRRREPNALIDAHGDIR
ncbi:MAG: VanZ family protein [Candidatus Binatia bacterium]